ncbi:phage baseplate assembly protein V [Pelagibius sp.]|uniref:phage baseplate assembly protein V n=1 Tax=Pelagibius sp. TaxID=1931238 RepID=UPI00262F3535|nr:phage baseplate assembly protein V [Pelagibius sp.]
MAVARRFYGKYRGTVAQNVDPMLRGRIQCLVPDVLGVTPSGWAVPCFPFAGPQMGAVAIPMIGSGVWVEFEQGDPEKPIWSGGWFGNTAEVPALALASPPGVSNVVVQTLGQNSLMMSDVPGPTGGILLKSMTGALISINDVGITLSNGRGATIAMLGNTVTVNQGALVVI